MANMSPNKVAMPEQDPNVRNKNFKEVALGYTKEMAMEEATRCLNCKNKPCVNGCPVNVPIPEFIEKVAAGDFEGAYEVITSENALPAICGRVCPQENQCEGKCVRGIKGEPVGIGRMERFVADYHMANAEPAEVSIEKNGKKVAVVGCGPAGITCAGEKIEFLDLDAPKKKKTDGEDPGDEGGGEDVGGGSGGGSGEAPDPAA